MKKKEKKEIQKIVQVKLKIIIFCREKYEKKNRLDYSDLFFCEAVFVETIVDQ